MIAAASDIVFTSLPTPREIEAVALGEDGIFENIKPIFMPNPPYVLVERSLKTA